MTVKRRAFRPEAIGPLSGVRVIDLSRLICGNTLTLMLADFGAEVLKVEPPEGDTLRSWQTKKVETYWKAMSRNKKSLCLNLRHPDSIEIIKELVRTSSVLVESFRPGILEKMGLAPDVLLAINPNLVIVRISGWGQTGPYSQRPGFGTLVEGMSGFANTNGFPDREPVLPPNALADSVAGFAGAMATLAALRHVEVSKGGGQVIDLPLLDPLYSILGPQAANYGLTGKIKPRSGSRSTNACPRNVYKTRDDKWVALSASIQAMAERLFRAIGRPDLIDDPKYKTNEVRVINAVELDTIIGDFIGKMSQAEAVSFFEKSEVTIGPIYDISQILVDPHFQEREIVVEIPDDDIGYIAVQGIVPRLSVTAGEFFRAAPKLGEHNDEALGWTGLPQTRLEQIHSGGALHAPVQVQPTAVGPNGTESSHAR